MRKEQLSKIFLAKLAGTPVFDPNGDRVGKVRDAVATEPAKSSNPRIIGFVVEVPQRRRILIPATRVTSIEDGGLITTGALNIRRYQAILLVKLFRHFLLDNGEYSEHLL